MTGTTQICQRNDSNFTLAPECSRVVIDVAVIDVSINEIFLIRDVSAHFVLLDNIDISSNVFHALFYDSSGNWALNPKYSNDNDVVPFVAINYPHRTINDGEHFCLLDTIFDNIEYDLGVSRKAFTPCTNIALTKQLIGLKTFYDLGQIRLSCSLDWQSIIDAVNCEIEDPSNPPETISADLIISVVFQTPTKGVYPTIVKLIYETEFKVKRNPYVTAV